MRKTVISAFIIFNTLMIGMANRPWTWRNWWAMNVVSRHWDSGVVRFIDRVDWTLSWYPYLAGTDLIASMFSTAQRTSWLIRITAYGYDNQPVILPLPFQTPRTFWQRYFFDHKEGKLFNNLYGDPNGCQHYAAYLCRHFRDPAHPIRDIKFEIVSTPFYPRQEAIAHGTHLAPDNPNVVIGDYLCGQ